MTTRRLVGLAAILIGLVVLGQWLRAREQTVPVQAGTVLLTGRDLQPESLDAIELSIRQPVATASGSGATRPGSQVRLVRDPTTGWRVASAFDAPADAARIQAFVSALRGLMGEERARGSQWFDDFGVGDRGLRVVALQGNQIVAGVVVGRSQKDPTTSYVKRHDGDVVCAVDRDILGEAGLWGPVAPESLTSQSWVDLRLVRVEPASVASVEVAERQKETWLVAPASGTRRTTALWLVRGERHAPFAEAKSTVELLTSLRGQEVLDPAAQQPVFQPQWRWIVTLQDGTRVELEEAAAMAGPMATASGGGATAPVEPTVVVRRIPGGSYVSVSGATLQQLRDVLIPTTLASRPVSTTPDSKKKKRKEGKR